MTAHASGYRPTALSIQRAGWMCLVVSMVGAAIGIALAFVPPAVDDTQWSYPLNATGYTFMQTWWGVQNIGVALGLFALWRSGAVGPSRLGRFGHYGAVTGMLGLAATELAGISAANDSMTTTRAGVLVTMYGVFTLLIGVALILEGAAILRTRKWQGWKRWLPLVLGLWVFVPMLPALALSPDWARFSIAGWMLLFGALGWALVKHEDHAV